MTASVAGVIVVVEGAQQIFQLHSNWISYRGSAELLPQHAFLYVASVKPYDQPSTRRARLAAALMDVVTHEKSNWSKVMEQKPVKGVTETLHIQVPHEHVRAQRGHAREISENEA